MFQRRRQALPKEVPPYGVLIGRIIFLGGLALVLLGVAFLVMLGLAGGSLLALLIFGLITAAGIAVCWLAVRDLTGPASDQPAVVTGRSDHPAGGNPVYELKFEATSSPGQSFSYNVTRRDWERYRVGEKVLVRYSAFFKLLVDIRPDK